MNRWVRYVMFLAALSSVSFQCLHAQDLSSCNQIINSGLREYDITTQSDAVLNVYYENFCQSSASSSSTGVGLSFEAVIKAIPVKFLGSYSSDSEAQTNFCKTYSSQYNATHNSYHYQEKIVTRGYDSYDQCVQAQKLGLGAWHTVDSKAAVTLKFTAGVNRPIELRSLRTDTNKISCKATDQKGEAALNQLIKSNDYIAVNCSRTPETTSTGDKVYNEGVIQTAGNYGTYDVYLPASQIVAERDAAVIYTRIGHLENLAASSADVAATVPKNGGPAGSNEAFFDFTDKQIHVDRTKSLKPGSPSYFLVPEDGNYYVEAALYAPWVQGRGDDYFSFYLKKMSAGGNDWEQVSGMNDWSATPRSTISVILNLRQGDKLALKAGNASGADVPMAGSFSVIEMN
jgi:hypothetical protein